MAETSGFFEAVYNETEGTYDLEYLASQFASYFALFIKNGVFGSPTNQLRVSAGTGMRVKVAAGWAFINGYWYWNDEELDLPVASNLTSSSRTDSVICRWDNASRRISVYVQTGTTSIVRDGSYYDLKLAEVVVPAGASYITESNISDTRTDETVCGLVTQLLSSQTTKDLFAQYESIFNEWFDSVRGQVDSDLGTRLQNQIGNLQSLATTNKNSVVSAVNEIEEDVEGLKSGTISIQNAVYAEEADYAEEAGTAETLSTPRLINGVPFDGSQNIVITDDSKPNVIFSTSEPISIPENTIVFVFEEE